MKASENQVPKIAFSVKEIAECVGVSERTIWKLIKSGELPSFRVGARVLISKVALDQFIAQRTQTTQPLQQQGEQGLFINGGV